MTIVNHSISDPDLTMKEKEAKVSEIIRRARERNKEYREKHLVSSTDNGEANSAKASLPSKSENIVVASKKRCGRPRSNCTPQTRRSSSEGSSSEREQHKPRSYFTSQNQRSTTETSSAERECIKHRSYTTSKRSHSSEFASSSESEHNQPRSYTTSRKHQSSKQASSEMLNFTSEQRRCTAKTSAEKKCYKSRSDLMKRKRSCSARTSSSESEHDTPRSYFTSQKSSTKTSTEKERKKPCTYVTSRKRQISSVSSSSSEEDDNPTSSYFTSQKCRVSTIREADKHPVTKRARVSPQRDLQKSPSSHRQSSPLRMHRESQSQYQNGFSSKHRQKTPPKRLRVSPRGRLQKSSVKSVRAPPLNDPATSELSSSNVQCKQSLTKRMLASPIRWCRSSPPRNFKRQIDSTRSQRSRPKSFRQSVDESLCSTLIEDHKHIAIRWEQGSNTGAVNKELWKLSDVTSGWMTKLRGSDVIPTESTLLNATRVLIIADSNSKAIRRIPVRWELIAIGGLNMERAGKIARRITQHSMPLLRHVIFAVGINDRDNSAADVRDCTEEIRLPGVGIHFQLIPQPPPNSVTKKAPDGIQRINEQAAAMSNVSTIELPDEIDFQNASSIHYIQSTVDRFVLGWVRHLNALVI